MVRSMGIVFLYTYLLNAVIVKLLVFKSSWFKVLCIVRSWWFVEDSMFSCRQNVFDLLIGIGLQTMLMEVMFVILLERCDTHGLHAPEDTVKSKGTGKHFAWWVVTSKLYYPQYEEKIFVAAQQRFVKKIECKCIKKSSFLKTVCNQNYCESKKCKRPLIQVRVRKLLTFIHHKFAFYMPLSFSLFNS